MHIIVKALGPKVLKLRPIIRLRNIFSLSNFLGQFEISMHISRLSSSKIMLKLATFIYVFSKVGQRSRLYIFGIYNVLAG